MGHLTVLFEDILRSGADVRVRVTGRSMAPFIADQDVVTLRRIPDGRVQCGDLVFHKGPGGDPVLHRVVWTGRDKLGKKVFRTKGDALSLWDPVASIDRILGRVIKIEKPTGQGRNQLRDLTALHWKAVNRLLGVAHHFLARKRRRASPLLTPRNPAW